MASSEILDGQSLRFIFPETVVNESFVATVKQHLPINKKRFDCGNFLGFKNKVEKCEDLMFENLLGYVFRIQ